MPDPANEPLPAPNSDQEYSNGVADNGSPVTIVSEHATPPWGENEKRPPIGPHAANAPDSGPRSPHHIESDKKTLAADRAHIERVRKCVSLMEGTVDLGEPARKILAKEAEIALVEREIELENKRRHLERLKAAPIDVDVPPVGATLASPAEPDDAALDADDTSATDDTDTPTHAPNTSSATGDVPPTPVGATFTSPAASPAKPRTRSRATQASPLRGPREPGVRQIKFSAALLLTLALRAAKDLPKLSAELRDLESKLLPAEAELKLKQEFYLDKAISVVTDTLNSMDEKFGPLGFGNWMPFRFPDQWLMFTGILNRVLAAHGLMPSGNAAIYRKLLDDTPAISLKAADAGRPPKSYGLGYRVREQRDMKGLLDRIAEVRAGRGPPL